jgi:hypothetical protein
MDQATATAELAQNPPVESKAITDKNRDFFDMG